MSRQFLIEPDFEQNVSERTIYTNYSGTTFTIERYYRTVEILMKCDEEPVIDIDCVFGANMIQYLSERYPNCELEYSIFHRCGLEFSRETPDDVWEKMKSDSLYDPTDDGWDVAETELWGYTDFSVTNVTCQ
jgi:hypothetical protein